MKVLEAASVLTLKLPDDIDSDETLDDMP